MSSPATKRRKRGRKSNPFQGGSPSKGEKKSRVTRTPSKKSIQSATKKQPSKTKLERRRSVPKATGHDKRTSSKADKGKKHVPKLQRKNSNTNTRSSSSLSRERKPKRKRSEEEVTITEFAFEEDRSNSDDDSDREDSEEEPVLPLKELTLDRLELSRLEEYPIGLLRQYCEEEGLHPQRATKRHYIRVIQEYNEEEEEEEEEEDLEMEVDKLRLDKLHLYPTSLLEKYCKIENIDRSLITSKNDYVDAILRYNSDTSSIFVDPQVLSPAAKQPEHYQVIEGGENGNEQAEEGQEKQDAPKKEDDGMCIVC